MADRRYIAQEITDSGQVEQVARGAMATYGDRAVAFIATTFWSWAIAHIDDDGRLTGKPDQLRSKIFARYLDLVRVEELAEVLAWMNDVDLLIWYEVQGSPLERYLYSPRFATHQTLRTDRYGPSRHPAPPGWQPDDGHPYAKNPELRKAKPQRDPRRTVRVAKRAAIKGQEGTLATTAHPLVATSAPARQPGADAMAPRGDETSPRLSSPHLSSPRLSPPLGAADAAPPAGAADELRSGTRGRMRPLSSVVTAVTRDTIVGAHYRNLTDLATDPGWPASKPGPGMFTDGRVRDRFGNVHASTTAFYDWARKEAEQLADAELKVASEKAAAAALETVPAESEDEPPIAESTSEASS